MCAALAAVIAAGPPARASSLRGAFEAAIALNPEIQALEARKDELFLRRDATGALLPGGPSAMLFHRNDAPFSNRGLREYEGELAFPLWLPGERSALLGSAETGIVRLEAEIALKRLDVARRLRESYWAVAEARERHQLADRRRAVAKALADDLRRQASAGQVALVDVSLAEADYQDAEAMVIMRKSELEQAIIQFRVLTGGQQPPSAFGERNSRLDFPSRHPRLVWAGSAIAKAEAELNVVTVVDRDRPELGIGVRTERADSMQPYDTNLGVRLKIPFAYEAVNAPKRAAAAAEIRGADAALGAAGREIRGEIAQARAKLDGARKQLAAIQMRYDRLAAAFTLIQASQRAGQTTLIELIRARNQQFDAANARALARVAVERARSDLNQALGLEP